MRTFFYSFEGLVFWYLKTIKNETCFLIVFSLRFFIVLSLPFFIVFSFALCQIASRVTENAPNPLEIFVFGATNCLTLAANPPDMAGSQNSCIKLGTPKGYRAFFCNGIVLRPWWPWNIGGIWLFLRYNRSHKTNLVSYFEASKQ